MLNNKFDTVSDSTKPSRDLTAYSLVIKPPAGLLGRLREERDRIYGEWGMAQTGKLIAHIGIATFFGREEMEETLIKWLGRVCHQEESFPLVLNNYSGYPNGTVYARIMDASCIMRTTTKLRVVNHYLESAACPPIRLLNNPCLPVESGLTEVQYQRTIRAYSQREFHEAFMVHELVLLKRRHAFDECSVVNIFALRPATQAGCLL